MRTSDLANLLELMVRKQIAITPCLWGSTGIGKSTIPKQLAKKMNYKVFDIRLSQLESVDLKGMPFTQFVTMEMTKEELIEDIKRSKTVGKINRIDTKGKGGSSFVYSFFIDNKMYVGRIDRDKNPYVKINEFYEIEYSSKNPHINKMILDEEITDSVKIMKAGYQKKTKFYKYDNFGNFLKEIDTLYFER